MGTVTDVIKNIHGNFTNQTYNDNDADDNDDEDGEEEYNYTSLKEKIHPWW